MATVVTTETTRKAKPQVVRRSAMGPRKVAILFTLLIFLVVLMLMFSSDYIPSRSMEPTLEPGDHIIAMRSWFAYPMNAMPARGDIITFRIPVAQLDGPGATDGPPKPDPGSPGADETVDRANFGSFFKDHVKTEVLIKRVIGLPGDRVLIKGNTVYINGRILKEEYKTIPPDPSINAGASYAVDTPLKVPDNELFVIGDNRNNSDDGRFWGTLKRRYVIGRFVHRLYNEGKEGPNILRAQTDP